MNTLPLKDYRILITRGKGQADRFKATIEQYGGTPIMVPLLAFQLPTNLTAVESVIQRISNYEWLILTSQNGVRFFLKLIEKFHVPPHILPKIAVIGTKTEEELVRYGYKADFIPKEFVAEEFVEEFVSQLDGDTQVLLAKGNLARTIIAEAINQVASCDEVIVYETVLPKESKEQLVHVLREREAEVITFTSSSTVHHFMQIVEQYQLHPYLESLIIACIGPVAKKTAVQYGLKVEICPEVYTTEAMLKDLAIYLQK